MKALVVTHAESHLACFTQEPDGTLKQRALLDVGPFAPSATELATIGTEMAKRFGWMPNGTRERLSLDGPPIRALERAKQRNPIKKSPQVNKGRSRNASAEEMQQRREAVVAYIKDHPNATVTETLTGLGLNARDQKVRGRWFWVFRYLRDEGMIVEAFRSRQSNSRGSAPEIHYKLGKATK